MSEDAGSSPAALPVSVRVQGEGLAAGVGPRERCPPQLPLSILFKQSQGSGGIGDRVPQAEAEFLAVHTEVASCGHGASPRRWRLWGAAMGLPAA